MTTQLKYDSALALIQEHNKVIINDPSGVESGQMGGKPGTIDTEKFLLNLKSYGAINEEDLKKLSYEDILVCLKPAINHGGEIEPRLLAKKIATVFRETIEEVPEIPKNLSSKKAEKLTPKELVDTFDPEDIDNPVGKRLQTVSKGEPFVVYKDGHEVDRQVTYSLLTELRQGYSPRNIVTVDGIPKPIYKLGQLPDNDVDENPVFPDRPLRPDGTCDQTNRSWAGISDEIRQFVRLIFKSGEMSVSSKDAHYILDFILGAEDPMFQLMTRFPKVYTQFNEAKRKGTLPRLKVVLGGPQGAANRPFEQGKQVVWVAAPVTANYYQSKRR